MAFEAIGSPFDPGRVRQLSPVMTRSYGRALLLDLPSRLEQLVSFMALVAELRAAEERCRKAKG